MRINNEGVGRGGQVGRRSCEEELGGREGGRRDLNNNKMGID